MKIHNILNCLTKVKRTGDGRYIACCPAHRDGSPSLSVRELPDGRILIHCFAGCEVSSILNTINLKLEDLFPESNTSNYKPHKRPFNASDVLACIRNESRLCAIVIADFIRGKLPNHDVKQRLLLAAQRLNEAYEVSND